MRSVISPCFKWSEVNTYLQPEGIVMSPREAFEQNLLALLDSYHQAHHDDNFVLICAKEKDGGDYKFNMACISTKDYETELHDLQMHDFKKVPDIVISRKRDVLKTIQKILKNIVFS